MCTAIQIRKQSGRSVKFRRLFIAFHCLQAIVAVPGSHEVLLDIISSLQPDEVVISGGWDMIKDWTWNGQLGFTKLVLYLYAGDDLRIIPEILSGCAETLTHLEIAMGYYHDGMYFHYEGADDFPRGFAHEPFPPKLPRLERLFIGRHCIHSIFEEHAPYYFETLMACIPEDRLLTVDELQHWTDPDNPLRPWHNHLVKQQERLAKTVESE